MVDVIAKVSGYHPASGLYLQEGEKYQIDESAYSADVFEKIVIKEVKNGTDGK